jgi:hypothetical protein
VDVVAGGIGETGDSATAAAGIKIDVPRVRGGAFEDEFVRRPHGPPVNGRPDPGAADPFRPPAACHDRITDLPPIFEDGVAAHLDVPVERTNLEGEEHRVRSLRWRPHQGESGGDSADESDRRRGEYISHSYPSTEREAPNQVPYPRRVCLLAEQFTRDRG